MAKPRIEELTDEELQQKAWRAAKGALAALEELERRRTERQGKIERESANPDTGIAAS